jgi:uncharacterized membrane protein YbhN (UPF0104 family)
LTSSPSTEPEPSDRADAIGYLWFDIAVLFECFAAAGHMPPLAPVVLAYQIGYLSNFIPVPGGGGSACSTAA